MTPAFDFLTIADDAVVLCGLTKDDSALVWQRGVAVLLPCLYWLVVRGVSKVLKSSMHFQVKVVIPQDPVQDPREADNNIPAEDR